MSGVVADDTQIAEQNLERITPAGGRAFQVEELLKEIWSQEEAATEEMDTVLKLVKRGISDIGE